VLVGLAVAASLGIVAGFFTVLVTGRYPEGIRDFIVSAYRYALRVEAYVGFLTDRYPQSDPLTMLESVSRPPVHPVHLVGEAHDLRRSRLTVFFRLPLFIPHYIWLYLWNYAALVVGMLNWFAALLRGRPPRRPSHGSPPTAGTRRRWTPGR